VSALDLHVLVVDDEADARELIALVLARRVRRVETAASAPQAFARIVEEPPDVLLSDICMPGEDGWSLIRRVRALPANRGGTMSAFALTALAHDHEIARTRAAGFDLVLTKPIDTAALVQALSSVGDGATPRRQPASYLVQRLRQRCEEARRLLQSARRNAARAVGAVSSGTTRAIDSEKLIASGRRLVREGGGLPSR
jgi:CheY-like chemotaxis protein